MQHERLRRREFNEVFKKGRKGAVGDVAVYVLPNNLHVCRVGFAVSRKAGGAVRRNRVRRLIKEVCRLHTNWFRIGFDYVVLGRVSAGKADYKSMESALEKAINRLKVSNDEGTRFKGD
ncbi:MAG: ribonuclease P protein component [Bacillota bacterium]